MAASAAAEEVGPAPQDASLPQRVEVIRRHKSRPTVTITRELLEELCLKYPQHQAAKVVGCGLTRFKTACRALGLPYWPYRRRKSVAALLDSIAGEEEAGEVVRILQAEDEALLKQPSKGLCRNFKRLRQAFYKEMYKQRKGPGGKRSEG